MVKQKIIYLILILILIFVAAFYVRTQAFWKYGFSTAREDGLRYTYLAAGLNRDSPPQPYKTTVQDFPPVFFYLSAFFINFFGEINAPFLLAAFLTSAVTVGTFFFVRRLTKSVFYSLAASALLGLTVDINSFYVESWPYAIAAALIPLFIFFSHKLLDSKDSRQWMLAGGLFGLHSLIHPVLTATVLLPIVFLFFAITERRRALKKIAFALVTFIAISLFYLPGLARYHLANFSQLYLENLELWLSRGSVQLAENTLAFLPVWFLVLAFVLLPITFIKIEKNKIKFNFKIDKMFMLFLIWFGIYLINFGVRFFGVNVYWSFRFMMLYPQLVLISLAVIFSRLPSKIFIHTFAILAIVIFAIAYPRISGVETFVPILDKQKVDALQWLDNNAGKNSTVLFVNNNPDYDGFGEWRLFSWRVTNEIGLQNFQSLLTNQSEFARDYTYLVVINSTKNVVQFPNGTVTAAAPLLVENSKKVGYDRIVYSNDNVLILSKSTLV